MRELIDKYSIPVKSITRKGVDPLYGKELMGIKSDKVYGRYTQRALFAGDPIARLLKS